MVNMVTRPMANSIGVAKVNLPPYMVAVQLRIFTPVGTAMNMVATEKATTDMGPMPEANMWCAHTPKPMKPMAIPEPTMNGYPKMGLREKTGMTSETMPKVGRIMM